MNITYTMQGDYRLPDLTLPEQNNRTIGTWGQRHKNYLLHHHKVRYYNLLTSCKLVEYLADINEQAEMMYAQLVKQFAGQGGCTEYMKATNQMLWIQKMNSAVQKAREIVLEEIVFR
ncbi:MAG: TnpV protein [Ruminococcus sp.]|nr:TnpV protein [Ruminococcus sp.]